MVSRKKVLRAAIEKVNADNAQYYGKLLTDMKLDVAKVSAIVDAGERYFALEDLKERISQLSQRAEERVALQLKELPRPPKTMKQILGIATASIGMPAGAASFVAPFLLPLTAISYMAGTMMVLGGIVGAGLAGVIGLTTAEQARTALAAETFAVLNEGKEGYVRALKAFASDIELQKKNILNGNLEDLASSSRFDALYDLPSVRAAFAKAAAKKEFARPQPVQLNKPAPRPKSD